MSSVKVKIDKKAIEQKIHNMINNKNNEMQIKINACIKYRGKRIFKNYN